MSEHPEVRALRRKLELRDAALAKATSEAATLKSLTESLLRSNGELREERDQARAEAEDNRRRLVASMEEAADATAALWRVRNALAVSAELAVVTKEAGRG